MSQLINNGSFLVKVCDYINLHLIGGAVDVKIIQVAEPPVTKTMLLLMWF